MRQESYGPTDYLQEEVLPALFERLDGCFPEFGWKRFGRGWEATNPDHVKSIVGASSRRLLCTSPRSFHIEGGEARTWLSYSNGGKTPAGREISAAAKALAVLAGVDVAALEREIPASDMARFEAAERGRSLLEAFAIYAHSCLMSARGKFARSYLVDRRGFAPDALDELPLGLYTTAGEVAEHLTSLRFSTDEAREAGLVAGGVDASGGSVVDAWPGRVVCPWRDRWGNTESVWALDIMRAKGTSGAFPALDALESFLASEPEGGTETPELLFLAGTRHDDLVAFGLPEALRGREGRENLVLVEHPIDALYLQSRGFANAAAICGPGQEMTRARWERLARFGLKSVTLVFANDLRPDGSWPGRDGTMAAIQASVPVPNVPAVYVVDPGQLGAAQDAAELVRDARGSVAPLVELVKTRLHAFRYEAMALIEKHKPEADWTDAGKGAALEEALAFDASVSVRDKFPDLDLFFWPELLEKTGAGPDAIHQRRDAAREKRGREALRRAYEELLADAGHTLKTRRLEDVKGLLRERVERIGAEERALNAEPILNVADEILAHDHRLRRLRGGDLMGLPQRTLRSLDLATLGLRGLVLLAGGPSTGKSALLLQLAVDVVRENPEACALVLSLEMPRWDFLSRLKCSLANVDWKTMVFGTVKGAGTGSSAVYRLEDLAAIRDSDQRLQDVGRRIRVLDERNFPEPSVDKVLEQLSDLKARTGAKRALIAVDDLAAWPISEIEARRVMTDVDADRFRVGALKTLRDAVDGDPVVAVAELRRGAPAPPDAWTAAFPEALGTLRGARTADVILLLRALTDLELAVAYKLTRERDGKTELDPQKVGEFREALRSQGKAYEKLEVAKGRDGVLRGALDVTFWFRKCRFEEGRR